MEDSRVASVILFTIAIILVATSFANYLVNIEPQYDYLADTRKILEQAQMEPTLERKTSLINQSLTIYMQGISQKNLQSLETLLTLDSTAELDWWLPKVINDIRTEQEGWAFSNPMLAMAILQIAFVTTTGFGVFGDYQKWSTGERHGYIAILLALILGITIGFI